MPEPPFIHDLVLVETDSIGPGTRIWAFAHSMPGARIGADCNVGEHTYIERNVTIGERAMVGAGAVVTKDVPDDSVVVGNPARMVRRLGPRA